jgi:hypothetical protein
VIRVVLRSGLYRLGSRDRKLLPSSPSRPVSSRCGYVPGSDKTNNSPCEKTLAEARGAVRRKPATFWGLGSTGESGDAGPGGQGCGNKQSGRLGLSRRSGSGFARAVPKQRAARVGKTPRRAPSFPCETSNGSLPRSGNPPGAGKAFTRKRASWISKADAGARGESWERCRTHPGESPGIDSRGNLRPPQEPVLLAQLGVRWHQALAQKRASRWKVH